VELAPSLGSAGASPSLDSDRLLEPVGYWLLPPVSEALNRNHKRGGSRSFFKGSGKSNRRTTTNSDGWLRFNNTLLIGSFAKSLEFA